MFYAWVLHISQVYAHIYLHVSYNIITIVIFKILIDNRASTFCATNKLYEISTLSSQVKKYYYLNV